MFQINLQEVRYITNGTLQTEIEYARLYKAYLILNRRKDG